MPSSRPTGNLDTRTSREVMDLFADVHEQGNTVVLVTHQEEIAACARRVLYLRDGCVERDVRVKEQL